jgi:hypothetical protein
MSSACRRELVRRSALGFKDIFAGVHADGGPPSLDIHVDHAGSGADVLAMRITLGPNGQPQVKRPPILPGTIISSCRSGQHDPCTFSLPRCPCNPAPQRTACMLCASAPAGKAPGCCCHAALSNILQLSRLLPGIRGRWSPGWCRAWGWRA